MTLDAIALSNLQPDEVSLVNLSQFLTNIGGAEFKVKPTPENPALVYLSNLGEGSRRTMKTALNTLGAIALNQRGIEIAEGWAKFLHQVFPWGTLRYQHTAAIRSALIESGRAHTTVNKHLSALRRVLKEAWRLGQIDSEDYQRAIDVANVQGDRLPSGRDLSAGESAALMETCTRTNRLIDYRDGALLSVLLAGGLRRAELVGLTIEDYEATNGCLKVTKAKRSKQRTVYLPAGGMAAMGDWLAVRGSASGVLFPAIAKGGHINLEKPMSTQAVAYIIGMRGDTAGVQNIAPHDFRRTFVGNLLDAGADLSVVQKLAGHSSPQTTARYDRRGERAKQDASARLHVPYRRSPV